MPWTETSYNTPVAIDRTVRDLFDLCDKHRGTDGVRNVSIRLGLLRRLADHLENEFEQVGNHFVRRRKTPTATKGESKR